MPRMILGREYLTPREAADKIGCQPATLNGWRRDGSGPPFIRMMGGDRGPVLYDAEGVDLLIKIRIEESGVSEKLAALREAAGASPLES